MLGLGERAPQTDRPPSGVLRASLPHPASGGTDSAGGSTPGGFLAGSAIVIPPFYSLLRVVLELLRAVSMASYALTPVTILSTVKIPLRPSETWCPGAALLPGTRWRSAAHVADIGAQEQTERALSRRRPVAGRVSRTRSTAASARSRIARCPRLVCLELAPRLHGSTSPFSVGCSSAHRAGCLTASERSRGTACEAASAACFCTGDSRAPPVSGASDYRAPRARTPHSTTTLAGWNRHRSSPGRASRSECDETVRRGPGV